MSRGRDSGISVRGTGAKRCKVIRAPSGTGQPGSVTTTPLHITRLVRIAFCTWVRDTDSPRSFRLVVNQISKRGARAEAVNSSVSSS